MSRFLLDVNAVLALLDPKHTFHDAAHRWLEGNSAAIWLTSPLVQNGVIRVASNPRYPNHFGTSADVRMIVREFCTHPRHEFIPDDVSLLDESHLRRPEMLTPARITDLYLLALARENRANFATFDSGIPAAAIEEGEAILHVIRSSGPASESVSDH